MGVKTTPKYASAYTPMIYRFCLCSQSFPFVPNRSQSFRIVPNRSVSFRIVPFRSVSFRNGSPLSWDYDRPCRSESPLPKGTLRVAPTYGPERHQLFRLYPAPAGKSGRSFTLSSAGLSLIVRDCCVIMHIRTYVGSKVLWPWSNQGEDRKVD